LPSARPGSIPFFSCTLHCGIMLFASACVLGITVGRVRKVALRQATGEAGIFLRRKQRRAQKKAETAGPPSEAPPGRIKRVKGFPVIWKELKAPLLRGGRAAAIIGITAAVAALLITYGVCASERCLYEAFTHAFYAVIFVILGILVTAVLSATAITTEKEARTWPILLATPLEDWAILVGKAIGIFRKCVPIWLFLAGHLLIFTLAGIINPVAIVHMAMLVAWIVVFFTGSGLYFSSRFKRTTTAVVMNFGLGLTLWAIAPMLLGMLMAGGGAHDADLLEGLVSTNPIVQTACLVDGAVGGHRLAYGGPGFLGEDVESATTGMFVSLLVYASIGALFAWRAKCSFRRNVF